MKSKSDDNKITELQYLLEEQVKVAQGGNINKLDELIEKAETIVENISTESLNDSDKARLRKLYDELSLAVKVQMEDTSGQLKHLGKSAKTIRTYHNNI